MKDDYVLYDSDPHNFVVEHVGGDGRYVFHVVPVEKGRTLASASWNRHGHESDPAIRVPDEARNFAESEARRLGLIE